MYKYGFIQKLNQQVMNTKICFILTLTQGVVFKDTLAALDADTKTAIEQFEVKTRNLTSICYGPGRAELYEANRQKVTALTSSAFQSLLDVEKETDEDNKAYVFANVIEDLKKLIAVMETYRVPEYDNIPQPLCDATAYTCSQENIRELLGKLAIIGQSISEDALKISQLKAKEECTPLEEKTHRENYEFICATRTLTYALEDCLKHRSDSPFKCTMYGK